MNVIPRHNVERFGEAQQTTVLIVVLLQVYVCVAVGLVRSCLVRQHFILEKRELPFIKTGNSLLGGNVKSILKL